MASAANRRKAKWARVKKHRPDLLPDPSKSNGRLKKRKATAEDYERMGLTPPENA